MTSQAVLMANERLGKWFRPVSFAQRIRSSTRALGAVLGVEVGELPERGVGGERGVAPPVGLFERVELRARVRPFATHDHPRPDRGSRSAPGPGGHR